MTGDEIRTIGLGYTLATGRLFCDFAEFHKFAEDLAGEPIWTHEFARKEMWQRLREAFEVSVLSGERAA